MRFAAINVPSLPVLASRTYEWAADNEDVGPWADRKVWTNTAHRFGRKTATQLGKAGIEIFDLRQYGLADADDAEVARWLLATLAD